MILSTSPVTARFQPSVREPSRAESGNVSGESSQVAAAQDVGKQEGGQSQAPSPVERVNQTPESEKNQKSRSVTDQSDISGLNEGERQVLEQLKARDREVRAHEAAHLAAAGSHATSGASFSYQRGPDGQLYAIGGEVGVSLSKVAGDPQATLDKAEKVRAAALAPAQPSSQDLAIAARASQLAAEAHREITASVNDANKGTDPVNALGNRDDAESETEQTSSARVAEQIYNDISGIKDEETSRLLDIQA